MRIIGNISMFFEIGESIGSKNLIPIRININGNYLGTLESTTYLPSFIGSLEYILEGECYSNNEANTENIKSILFNKDGELTDKYRVTFEETFDDFSKRVVRSDELIFFYYELHCDSYFNYPDIEEGSRILETIPKKDYINALELLKKYIFSIHS